MTRIGTFRMEIEKPSTSKALAFGLVATLMILIMLLAAKPAQAATTITVNSTGDENDLDFPSGVFDGSSDGKCDVDPGITGDQCTLRAAIQEANVTSGADTITFGISTGVQTISPSSALPTITDPVTIDGTLQPGYAGSPVIELNGASAGAAGVDGLTITAGNSTVKGLAIYKFSEDGIELQTNGGNTVTGNYIGTDATGTASDKGNGNRGVFVNHPDNNMIGGSHPGEGNVISGNDTGVRLGHTEGTTVQGNLIGTDKNGTADLGNSSTGVLLDNAFNCTVGGTASEAGNVIAFNGPDFDFDGEGVFDDGGGVVVLSNAENDILSNSIFSNIGLGIDLDDGTGFPLNGLTPNDLGDGDVGANSLQNFPVIKSATASGGMTTIKGKLNSTDSQTFTVQFFSSPEKDPSGNGEGKKFLGQKPVTTNADGNASFTFKKKVPKGQFVTATATSSFDGTSEFSNARKVKRP